MNKKITMLVLLIFVTAATLSGCITGQKKVDIPGGGKVIINEGDVGPDWCKTGTKITSSGIQGQQGSFEIKGITTYNDTKVCEAEYIYDKGSMVQYFNEKGDYVVMLYKDKNGTVIQQIAANNPKS